MVINQLDTGEGLTSPEIQVIIAALNEEKGIGLTITEMMDTLNDVEVIVVDGKRTDRTSQIAKNLGEKVACQDGKGKGDAIAKDLKYISTENKYVVITDADYTYPAQYVPEMIQTLKENPEVGMVCGNRFNGNVDPEALRTVFHIGNKLMTFVHQLVNGVPLNDPLTGLRVVRADILRDWKVKSKGFDIEVELNNYVQQTGYETVEIPIQYRQRLGQKKLGLKNGVEIFKRMMLEMTP